MPDEITPQQQQQQTTTSIHDNMPRLSKRKRFIAELHKMFKHRMIPRAWRTMDDEEDSVEDAKDVAVAVAARNAEGRRYLFRQPKYRKGEDRFVADLDADEEPENEEITSLEEEEANLPWLTADEFLQKYRMSRQSFSSVLEEIKDHEIFKRKGPRGSGRVPAPVVHQLMVFLKYVGTEGSGASNANQRHTFSIGYGTAEKYRRRVTRAILSLRDKYYYWPDEDERKQISLAIHEEYKFPHCVGIADGTLFPLAFEPRRTDAPDYSGRKYGYSLSTLIICDHKRRIRHYLAGFPGSAHDNRVWRNTELKTNPREYFSETQYVVGDSAFENDWMMVSAYKKAANCTLEADHEFFNTRLAKVRIISEHCIGILKGRFPWLRSIRLFINEDQASIRRILQLLDATVILHNMLIEFGEEENEEWIDYDDFSDIAMQSPYEDGDELNRAVPLWAPKDTRRNQLLHYFKEHWSLL
jgi:hypothetical protein